MTTKYLCRWMEGSLFYQCLPSNGWETDERGGKEGQGKEG